MTKKLKKSLPQSHLRSTAPSSEGAIRLRVADNKCAAGSPTKKVSDKKSETFCFAYLR